MIKKAFTLAETLITLVIIGVIAAICVPVIFNNYQEQERAAKVKKAYSTISRAFNLLKVTGASYLLDDKTYINDDKSLFDLFENYIKPNLITNKICKETKGCWSNDDTKFLNGKIIDFELSRPGIGIGDGIISAILNDGTLVTFNMWDLGAAKQYAKINYNGVALRIAFDINGAKKPTTIGKDIFYILYIPGRGVIPAYADATKDEIKNDCTKNGQGLSCIMKYLNQ